MDLLLKDCMIYDGSGKAPFSGDIAIEGGRIIGLGGKIEGQAKHQVSCHGLAAAPGFINLHSWAATDLLADGRAMSDVLQGVTMEVFGESWSEGPLSREMKTYIKDLYGVPEIPWTTLSEFLIYLSDSAGVSTHVASFVGVNNLRYHTVGQGSRAASGEDLAEMCRLLEMEMQEGAMGVGSALIYVPGMFFKTQELQALAATAFRYGGAYISHIRSEADRFEEALTEFLTINQGGRGILYHFKLQGKHNWNKLPQGLAEIAEAQRRGTEIGACVYPYTAGMTGISAALPPWAREDGFEAMLKILADPKHHERLKVEMSADQDVWENLYVLSGGAGGVRMTGFTQPEHSAYSGLALAEIAARMGVSAEEAIIRLILAEKSDPKAIFFHSSEENLKTILKQSWVCLGSDVGSMAEEAAQITHPRAFGTFARFLGYYCRQLGLMPLQEGVRRLTSLPAHLLHIDGRHGFLRPGYAADVVIFDPEHMIDHATFDHPMRYASGVEHVFVRGEAVVENGAHSGAKPGRFVRGPGWKR